MLAQSGLPSLRAGGISANPPPQRRAAQLVARCAEDRRKSPATGAGPSWSCPAPGRGKAANVRCKECPDGFIKFHNGRLSIKNSIKLKKACVYSRALCLSPDRQQNKDIEAVAVGFLPPRQHVYPAQRHLLLGGVERREKAPLRRG